MNTFIVATWSRIISGLRWLSPLGWLWRVAPRLRTFRCVDIWVLVNLVFASATLVTATAFDKPQAARVLCAYAAVRVLEIIVYQVWLILFAFYENPTSDPDYAVRGYRRIVILALHNYLEVVIWFGAAYATFKNLFAHSDVLSTGVGAFYYSMVTMSTVGYGEVTPASDLGRLLVTAHLAVGVFMSIVILARFVSYLPTPNSMDAAEKLAAAMKNRAIEE